MQLLWEGLLGALRLIVEGDPLVLSAAWRSLWISLLAVLLATTVGCPIGSLLARIRFRGRGALVFACRAAMSIPTVLIGLLLYALLSRRGIFGGLQLLYTSGGIVLGEFCLALPIIITWVHSAISGLDRRVFETAWTLNANPLRRWVVYLSEVRTGIALAIMTAFARCVTELGIAMMVGGNIKYRTRTLTTATALETARGEFSRGVAMSLILLCMAISVTLVIAWFSQPRGDE